MMHKPCLSLAQNKMASLATNPAILFKDYETILHVFWHDACRNDLLNNYMESDFDDRWVDVM
jgi:hypothetical protein